MARSNNGWVALSRKLIRSWIWNDPEYLKMWCWLIMSANYEKSQVYWHGSFKDLERGQIITSRRELAKECQVDAAKAGRFLSALESEPQSEPFCGPKNEPQISSLKGPRGTIITILNYEKYQSPLKKVEPLNEPRSKPLNEPQSEPQSDTIRTIKQKNKTTTQQESFPSDEPTGTVELFPVEVLPPEKKKETPKTLGSFVWDAYQRAYQGRYQVPPIRNAKVNVLCSQLVKRLGMVDAVQVVAFYLTHNDRWYVQKGHALEYCVKDAEKLHMEWSRGSQITSLKAVTVERDQGNADAIRAYFAKQDEK